MHGMTTTHHTTPSADQASSGAPRQQRQAKPSKASSPTPDQVRTHRLAHGHTQAQAAQLVHMPPRTWQKYEAGDNAMHPALWELYRIKCELKK